VIALGPFVPDKLSFGTGVGSGTIGVTLGLAGIVPGIGVGTGVSGVDSKIPGLCSGVTLGDGVAAPRSLCARRREVIAIVAN